MIEFNKFATILQKLNIKQGVPIRSRFKEFPYDGMKIKNSDFREDFFKWSNRQKTHPQHVEFEMNSVTEKVTIKFTNESTNKFLDHHKLLDKEVMQNQSYVYVNKGFIRTYDFNNMDDVIELQRFMSGFKLNPPTSNQSIPVVNNINYQDLNLMEKYPDLTRSLIIHAMPLDIITPNDAKLDSIIKKSHVLAENNKINLSQYKYAQSEHRKLSKSSQLSFSEQQNHHKIATEMDFIKSLNTFMSKFFY